MKHLHPLFSDITPPERFTYPFCYEPHPLCQLAAKEVQAYIASHEEIRKDADQGKMFGVLVVQANTHHLTPNTQYSFLAAYSGLLAGRNDWEYFVPPVYDAQQPDGYFKTKEREISELVHHLTQGQSPCASNLTQGQSPCASNLTRGQSPCEMSQELQLWLFHQYQLLNAKGETKDLVDIWQNYYDRPKLRAKYPLPPGGTGDCCAPKLLQYAYQQGLKPICMAEFWWGQSTKEELRQHGNFYPACRGKCKPILTWMMEGLDVDVNPETLGFPHLEIETIYEDDALLVVNKPSGMLSTPGRTEEYSVETVMRQRYPDAVIAHRLDMGTSGLMIVAKSMETYHPLQEQFVKHQVKKRYIALLEVRGERLEVREMSGTISLPLRPDPMNRPRQVVDMEHGKRAVTDYEILNTSLTSHLLPLTSYLVALYPQTGRTHQLRIHCAHPDGLGCPIKGDELYGTKSNRLYLHAEQIWFRHPVTGEDMHFTSPAPFL